MPLLIKRKSKYSLDANGNESSDTPVKNPSGISATRVTVSPPSSEPVAAAPTRLRSTSAFQGERFPETRLREITTEEIAQWDDENLRYATNEMYARYGMTFKDKDYQRNFSSWKWYQPNEKWKPSQIERAFTTTEKENLKLLIAERDTRRSNSPIE